MVDFIFSKVYNFVFKISYIFDCATKIQVIGIKRLFYPSPLFGPNQVKLENRIKLDIRTALPAFKDQVLRLKAQRILTDLGISYTFSATLSRSVARVVIGVSQLADMGYVKKDTGQTQLLEEKILPRACLLSIG